MTEKNRTRQIDRAFSRSYERLHEAALREQRSHAGILIANRRAADFDLARRIMTVLNTFTAEEVVKQLFYR